MLVLAHHPSALVESLSSVSVAGPYVFGSWGFSVTGMDWRVRALHGDGQGVLAFLGSSLLDDLEHVLALDQTRI